MRPCRHSRQGQGWAELHDPAQFGHRGTCSVCWGVELINRHVALAVPDLHTALCGGLSSPGDPWD